MTSFWTGDRVRLRGIEPEDWPTLMGFEAHSGHQRSNNALRPPAAAERYRTWAKEVAGAQSENDAFTLAVEALDSGALVGSIVTHHVHPVAGRFMYGLSIGDGHQRRGYATEAAILVLRFMFAERRFHKCEVEVFAYNEPSLALHRRLGFVEEGRLRDHSFAAGRHLDVIRMGILADEFAARYSLGTV